MFQIIEYSYWLCFSIIFGKKVKSLIIHQNLPSETAEITRTAEEDVSIIDQEISLFEDCFMDFMNEMRSPYPNFLMNSKIKQEIINDLSLSSIVKERVLSPVKYSQKSFNKTFLEENLFNLKKPGVSYFEYIFYTRHPHLNFVESLPITQDDCQTDRIFRLDTFLQNSNKYGNLHFEILEHHILKNNAQSDFNDFESELGVAAHFLKNDMQDTVSLCLEQNIWIYHPYFGRCRFRDFWNRFGDKDQISLVVQNPSRVLTIKLSKNKVVQSSFKPLTEELEEEATVEPVVETQSASHSGPLRTDRTQETSVIVNSSVPSGNGGSSGGGNYFFWILLVLLPFMIIPKIQSYFRKSSNYKKIEIYESEIDLQVKTKP